jgi:hypothetical protein
LRSPPHRERPTGLREEPTVGDVRKLVQFGPAAYAVVGKFARKNSAGEQDAIDLMISISQNATRLSMTLDEARELADALDEVLSS